MEISHDETMEVTHDHDDDEEASGDNSNSMSKTDLDVPVPVAVGEVAEEQPQKHKQQSSLQLQHVVDDFSLQSQGMRFRPTGREIRVYEQAGGQLILEERRGGDGVSCNNDQEEADHVKNNEGDGDGGILVKSTKDHGYAFSFLRALYSLMAMFVGRSIISHLLHSPFLFLLYSLSFVHLVACFCTHQYRWIPIHTRILYPAIRIHRAGYFTGSNEQ